MENRTKTELNFMSSLEKGGQVSQSNLAKKLGIAAGLVNILMKRAVRKGLVKMRQVPARRYVYYLTPKGFAEKSRLVAHYLEHSLSQFRKLRVEYRNLLFDLEIKGVKKIVLVGDIEIAELVIIASFDTNIIVTALINAETNKDRVGPVPIHASLDQTETQSVLICDAQSPQQCYENLLLERKTEDIYFPATFYISPNLDSDDHNEAA